MQIVIDIPEDEYKRWQEIGEMDAAIIRDALVKGVPLPKGHGKLVDISQINRDKIERDNPISSLNINGLHIEVVSLDYLDNLPVIVEADHGSGS